MIIIYGGVRVDPAREAEITAKGTVFQSKCQAEEGCQAYLLSWDIAGSQTVRLVEVWADEESYLAHKEQDHVGEWTDYMKQVSLEPPAFIRTDC